MLFLVPLPLSSPIGYWVEQLRYFEATDVFVEVAEHRAKLTHTTADWYNLKKTWLMFRESA